jgi:hypothetical protein
VNGKEDISGQERAASGWVTEETAEVKKGERGED